MSAVVSESPEAARICAARWELDGAGGILLARPPADGIDLGPLIDEAVEEVRGQKLSGQAVTPAVLSIVHARSGGAQRGGQPPADRGQHRPRRRDRRRLRPASEVAAGFDGSVCKRSAVLMLPPTSSGSAARYRTAQLLPLKGFRRWADGPARFQARPRACCRTLYCRRINDW